MTNPYQDPTAEMQIQYAINYGIVRLILWQVNKQ